MKKLLILVAFLGSMNLMADEKKADSINGAQLWSDVCARCHNVRMPGDYSKRAWKFSMNHMRIRAGLTGQETRDVLAFILESKTVSDAK